MQILPCFNQKKGAENDNIKTSNSETTDCICNQHFSGTFNQAGIPNSVTGFALM